jgi:hypothetical protein
MDVFKLLSEMQDQRQRLDKTITMLEYFAERKYRGQCSSGRDPGPKVHASARANASVSANAGPDRQTARKASRQ